MIEGVTKFQSEHRDGPLRAGEVERVGEMLAWRRIWFDLGLIGRDPQRYDGAGYGNLSVRAGAPSAPRGRRPFLVTGTQTGGTANLRETDLCVVESYDVKRNAVVSRGPARPSSESLTHGAIYDLSTSIRVVLHVHAPLLWRSAQRLGLPCTRGGIDYGTPAMAMEVHRLYRDTHLADARVLSMTAHEDGIVAFGSTWSDASSRLLEQQARALAGALPSSCATSKPRSNR